MNPRIGRGAGVGDNVHAPGRRVGRERGVCDAVLRHHAAQINVRHARRQHLRQIRLPKSIGGVLVHRGTPRQQRRNFGIKRHARTACRQHRRIRRVYMAHRHHPISRRIRRAHAVRNPRRRFGSLKLRPRPACEIIVLHINHNQRVFHFDLRCQSV